MSFLSRLEVDARTALRENLIDAYRWHQAAWACFPDSPEAERDFLFRVDEREEGFLVWILSRRKPERPVWCAESAFEIRPIAESFLGHGHYAFDVVVNPTKRLVVRDEDGNKRKNGRRVALTRPEELTQWFDQKALQCGFRRVESVPLDSSPVSDAHFRKKEMRGKHGGTRFRGILEVKDPVKFRDTYEKGIGTARSFGFGLLLLSPVQLPREEEK